MFLNRLGSSKGIGTSGTAHGPLANGQADTAFY